MSSNKMLDEALVLNRENLLDFLGVPKGKHQLAGEVLDEYIDLRIEKRFRSLQQSKEG